MPQYQGIWSLQSAAQLQSTQRWVTDPSFDYTTLLLQADNAPNGAQNNTFLDSSSNNFTITRNGNTTQGTFTPYSLQPGAWSNYFDGSGDYLTLPVNAAFDLGTNACCIEAWVYPINDDQIGLFCTSNGASGQTRPNFYVSPTQFQADYFANVFFTGAVSIPKFAWSHVAFTRDATNGAWRFFLNGVLTGYNATGTQNLLQTTVAQRVGFYASVSANAYMSNVRVVNGSVPTQYQTSSTAVGTVVFSPSTTPLTAVTNTALLTCQSNRFVDNSTNAFAITVAGNPSVQAFSPFAPQYQWTAPVIGGSAFFDGTGDFLATPSGQQVSFGTGDFTIEAWMYFNSVTYPTQAGIMFGDGVGWTLYIFPTARLQWGNISPQTPANLLTGSTTLVTGQWYHVAITRQSGTVRMWLNGALDGTVTNAVDFSASGVLKVGVDHSTDYFSGYMSSLRILKGTALYTTAFTPPTGPLTAIANTSVLLNFTNAGIVDGTMKNNLETVGNAQVSTSVVKYGTGSMAFDGTGDYLKGNQATSNLYVFEGDFTVEMWVYSGSFAETPVGGAFPTIFATSSFSGTGIGVKIQSAGGLGVSGCACVWYNGSQILTGTTSIANSTWTHVAVSRINGFMRLFVNGTQQASTTNTATFTVSSGYPLIGADTTTSGTLNGYIDDLRITKGIARYTANFTPPTVALPRQ